MEGTSAANLLRELRRNQARSLRQVAGDLGVAPSYLSRIERGERTLSEGLTARVAKYYGVAEEQLAMAEGRLPEDVLAIIKSHPEVIEELRKRFRDS